MNLERYNSWFTLVANVGVLLGIVFLAVEVQQNNQIARGQMRMDISDSIRANLDMLGSERGISIQAKFQRGEEISIEDEIWLGYAFRNELKAWENFEYQFSLDLFDPMEYEKFEQVWRTRANSCTSEFGNMFFKVFEESKQSFRDSFKTRLESFFQANNCAVGT